MTHCPKHSDVAAFALWEFPTSLTEEQKAQKAALEDKAKRKVHLAGTNVALRTDFFGQINRMRKKYIDPSHDYCKSLPSSSHHAPRSREEGKHRADVWA